MHIPCIFPCIFPSFQYSSNRASGDMKLYETANITEFLLHLRCSISNHITNLSPTYHQPYLIELTITNHIPYSTKLHLIPPMNHHPNLWDLPGQIHWIHPPPTSGGYVSPLRSMAQSSTSRGQQGFCGAQPLRAVEAKQVSGSTSQKACGRILMVRFPNMGFSNDGWLEDWWWGIDPLIDGWILMGIFPFWLEDFPTWNPKSSNHPFWKIDEDWLMDWWIDEDWWRLIESQIIQWNLKSSCILRIGSFFSFFGDFFQRKPLVGRWPKMVVAPN